MKSVIQTIGAGIVLTICIACNQKQMENESTNQSNSKEVTAKEILGNPDYLAISYGGYRQKSRDVQPTIEELKEDLRILSAMGIKILRTYNVHYPHAANVLRAIRELKTSDPTFEMYVMLGAWIDCKNARTSEPDHAQESERNEHEIESAIELVNRYPDIVKIIAVGNEAMVNWAASYYVQPWIILKWVNHLQALKTSGKLPKELWITSSDDFASWGGGDPSYHTETLEALIKAVDYISMHTYPYHNTHYNPDFWRTPREDRMLSDIEKIDVAMLRAKEFARMQYEAVSAYVKSLGVSKPIHIGETGWATISDGFYGPTGSHATDEYKQGLFYKHIREWTNTTRISCFYFEAFDEQWKDAGNPSGSENHFGLFTLKGEAKYAVWDFVDQGIFLNLSRDGNPIVKTYQGEKRELIKDVLTPPEKPDAE